MKQALRHMLGVTPSGQRYNCKCGEPMLAGHAHTCNRVSGPATTMRHEVLGKDLANAADAFCGVTVQKTPRVAVPPGDAEDKRDATTAAVALIAEAAARAAASSMGMAANVGAAEKKDKKVVPDWAFYGAAVNFATDVTVLCGEAKTHLPPVASLTKLAQQYGGAAAVAELKKRVKGECAKRAGEKRASYDAPCGGEGMDFVPYVVESHGFLHDSAVQVLNGLARNARIAFAVEHAALASYLKRRAAIALQRGNALLECEARHAARNSLGGKIGSGLFVSDD